METFRRGERQIWVSSILIVSTDATNDELILRRAKPSDESAILRLVSDSLGTGTIPRTRDYWQWKHLDNPFGQSPMMVAEHAGRVVGLRVFMRWIWRSGDREVSAVRAVDTATHPDFQGRGIFKRLTLRLRDEMEAEGASLVFNTPNAQSRPGYLKMGWSSVGKPTLWMRLVRPIRLVHTLQSDGLSGGEEEPPLVDSPSAAEVLAQAGVAETIDAASAVPYERLHTPCSHPYLQWRYADVPSPSYQAVVRGQGADGALIFFRSRQRGKLRELRLCDIVVGPTRVARSNARWLLGHVSTLADVDVVIAMATGRTSLRSLLMSAAYVPVPRSGPILTVYPFAAAADLADPRCWRSWGASIGDLELF